MPNVSQSEHDAIFAMDTATVEGATDGSGAPMVTDLGDKVIPCPPEFNVKLFREMIHARGIDTAVLFM
eukprot:1332224-Lingulodinium_polyedra.AAC.1